MESKPLTVGIIGTGRFGGVIAKIFHNDPTHFKIKIASNSQPIDNQTIFALDEVLLSDIVVPAIPISSLEGFLISNASKTNPSSLWLDICSVNIAPCSWLMQNLPATCDIVSSHPLFGPNSTKQGTLFKDLDFVYWPIRLIDLDRWQKIVDLLNKLQLHLIKLTPTEHDRYLAKTLLLAFIVGHMTNDAQLSLTPFKTPGTEHLFANQVTVMSDSNQLFCDLLSYNPFAQTLLNKLRASLDNYSAIIRS